MSRAEGLRLLAIRGKGRTQIAHHNPNTLRKASQCDEHRVQGAWLYLVWPQVWRGVIHVRTELKQWWTVWSGACVCVCVYASRGQRRLYSVHKQPQQQQNWVKQPGVQLGSVHVYENTNAFIGSLKKTKVCSQICTFNVTQVQRSVLTALRWNIFGVLVPKHVQGQGEAVLCMCISCFPTKPV